MLFKQTAFCDAGDQTLEHWSHRFYNQQGVGGEGLGCSRPRSHFPQTTGELCDREVISRCHGIFKRGVASRRDDLVQRILRRASQAIQRYRFLRWEGRCGRGSLPPGMVQDITASSRRAGTPRSRNADRAKTIHEHTRFSFLIIQLQLAFDVLVVVLLHASVDEA